MFRQVVLLCFIDASPRFYLMEAQEVQDGWRCVEYVALGGHHQHKAVESLRSTGKC